MHFESLLSSSKTPLPHLSTKAKNGHPMSRRHKTEPTAQMTENAHKPELLSKSQETIKEEDYFLMK